MSEATATRRLALLDARRLLVYQLDRRPVLDARVPADASEISLGAGIAFVDYRRGDERVLVQSLEHALGDTLRFVDPMFELGRYETATREAVVRALAIARWSADYRHCPQCGRPLSWDVAGASKVCNDDPPHRHFPRLDPATIMLVSDGERALLGRQSTWPPGMYSTLAGFVDRGESLEEAVAREVREEAGVEVTDIRYFGSEPWPFPRSLMLGFTARATTTDIVRGDELEDARWFTVAQTRALVALLDERAPYADTIARRLIRSWLAERSNSGQPAYSTT